ncbi:hypothetical protein D3C85_1218640 [compost metagenome]
MNFNVRANQSSSVRVIKNLLLQDGDFKIDLLSRYGFLQLSEVVQELFLNYHVSRSQPGEAGLDVFGEPVRKHDLIQLFHDYMRKGGNIGLWPNCIGVTRGRAKVQPHTFC